MNHYEASRVQLDTLILIGRLLNSKVGCVSVLLMLAAILSDLSPRRPKPHAS